MQVNVLTAVHPPYADSLRLTWESLLAQTHREWSWLVQIDGAAEEVFEALDACGALSDPRVRPHAHLTSDGVAVARNIALGRADAPLVQNLDADDELEPDALKSLSDALRAHPSAGFAAGQARDLLPDGTLVEHQLDLSPGTIQKGALERAWLTDPESYRVPLHPAGVMWRTDLLLRLGGWPALHGMEDTALLISASSISTGLLLPQPTLRYRIHNGQSSAATENFSGGGSRLPSSEQEPAYSTTPNGPNPRRAGSALYAPERYPPVPLPLTGVKLQQSTSNGTFNSAP